MSLGRTGLGKGEDDGEVEEGTIASIEAGEILPGTSGEDAAEGKMRESKETDR